MNLQHLTVPDLWQRDAVQHLRAGRDVVVHAPTGAGKTYIFELLYPEMKGQAVFTVPTRALANDKLGEWRARGWDVGISTGDLAMNLDAKVVVATLETQRGRFLRREGPRVLVVDEYQMIGDPVRGVNYELALALAPAGTQILLLSGSVANPADIVGWLRRIGRDAVLVSHDVRPVPLTEVDIEALPSRAPLTVRGVWPRLIANSLRADLGPILMFAPRRNAAEEFAQTLASQIPCEDPLVLSQEQEALAGTKLTKLLRARVAYHHSGLSYALRAGVIEPLAKNGQLRVVVATMGLAAGINFSMRSVVITDTRYMAGNFERQVQPDELLQMFGRAGRRGLDESGHVLFTSRGPRLLDARARHLRRSTQLDWPTLIAVMQTAVKRGDEPFQSAMELNRRLYTPQEIAIGVEHSRSTGSMPCGLMVDMERARLPRRAIAEMQNSRDEWQLHTAPEPIPLSDAWVLDGDRWRPALSHARTLDGVGYGELCRLPGEGQRRYGRQVILGRRKGGSLELSPWLSDQIGIRNVSPHGLQVEVLARLPEYVSAAAVAESKRANTPIKSRVHMRQEVPDAVPNPEGLKNLAGRTTPGSDEQRTQSGASYSARKRAVSGSAGVPRDTAPPFFNQGLNPYEGMQEAITSRPTSPTNPSAKFTIASVFTRGDQLIAHLDYSAHRVPSHRDSHGRYLIEPPTREVRAACCEGCPELPWCLGATITVTPAWAWRKLGLIEKDGTPTRRGIIFSYFYHGEGLAIAAALEDATYPIEDLVFDLANLRAGSRFSGDEAPHAGRLGALCQTVYERADFPGYLDMGVPTEYGAGASEVVRESVEHHTPKGKLLTEWLRPGDIERVLIEWRSLLRHITLSPDYDWDRWQQLRAAARRHVENSASPTLASLPALLASQRRRL